MQSFEEGFETRAIHAGHSIEPVTGAVTTPIYMTSTFAQPTPGEHLGYEYSRSGNPTRAAFEACIASLESGRFGFATASGSVATATILQLLKTGDHVICCDDLYGGTQRQFNKLFARFGIEFSYVDLSDPSSMDEHIRANTRLVWIESPTNPLLKLIDIEAVSQRAHAAGAWLAVDNTFMSPYFQRPLELGADIVMHSTTKYIAGHSDLVGGAIVTDDDDLGEQLAFYTNALGGIQSTFDSYLCLRSVKTLAVRMQAHERNAIAVAKYLEDHPAIDRVLFPGLASHPQHELATRQMSGYGGMVSAYLKGGISETRKFLEGVSVFTLAESLGGVESLVEHPALMTHASLPASVRDELGIGDTLVRLSVGIESEADLLADLDQALS
ncbi:MAG: PLP-dependent aspartate aminotransferase family protein [Pseudomonadaceae bacterium]|nr:PLP-dependent aspartate aminotransferase family protein [Pseudomonadaceae bacterium]